MFNCGVLLHPAIQKHIVSIQQLGLHVPTDGQPIILHAKKHGSKRQTLSTRRRFGMVRPALSRAAKTSVGSREAAAERSLACRFRGTGASFHAAGLLPPEVQGEAILWLSSAIFASFWACSYGEKVLHSPSMGCTQECHWLEERILTCVGCWLTSMLLSTIEKTGMSWLETNTNWSSRTSTIPSASRKNIRRMKSSNIALHRLKLSPQSNPAQNTRLHICAFESQRIWLCNVDTWCRNR